MLGAALSKDKAHPFFNSCLYLMRSADAGQHLVRWFMVTSTVTKCPFTAGWRRRTTIHIFLSVT